MGGGVSVSGAKKPVIPDFEMMRTIGRGSYGDVWLARGLTGVYRAVKVVWRDRFADAEPFEREFKGLKKFTTMSLPESSQLALLHVGQNEAEGFFYYVMELADDVDTGREVNPARYHPLTLKEVRARRGRVAAEECVVIGVELARALAGLHSRGLIHRDIKPSNVIMVGGLPKLADIGLVASTHDARTFVGTEGYVPPEGPGKPSADVFALGKLLYELATGLDREEYPRLPEELGNRPDRRVLLELNEVILRSCEPEDKRRYPDASAVLADLLELQAGNSLRLNRSRARFRRLAAVLMLAVAAAGAVYWWRMRPATSAPAPPSDARQLVAKAWEQMNKTGMGPEELEFADGFCKRALELDPTDADAWAAWSQVNSLYCGSGIDNSAAHREAAGSDAARALKLAGDSYEASLAQASFLVRLGLWTFMPEADRRLHQLLKEQPDEPRALRVFGQLERMLGHPKEARAAMIRLARNPKYAAVAWLELADIADEENDVPAFDTDLDRSIAIQPYAGNLSRKLGTLLGWRGDLVSADAVLKKIPSSLAQSDALAAYVFRLYYFQRRPDNALSYLQGIPHDWMGGHDGGPIGYFAGEAQKLAGRDELAKIEWRRALKLVENRLADQPTSSHLLALKLRLLAFLGEFEGAEKSLKVEVEARRGQDWIGLFFLKMAEGQLDATMDIYEGHIGQGGGFWANAAVLRLDPELDPLRNNARFKAELARAEADPSRSPDAPFTPENRPAKAAKPK